MRNLSTRFPILNSQLPRDFGIASKLRQITSICKLLRDLRSNHWSIPPKLTFSYLKHGRYDFTVIYSLRYSTNI